MMNWLQCSLLVFFYQIFLSATFPADVLRKPCIDTHLDKKAKLIMMFLAPTGSPRSEDVRPSVHPCDIMLKRTDSKRSLES